MSSLTHVEIAIGEEAGVNGMMTNVCRVFNDRVGVELVERTGRNPQYVYQQLGCSKKAVSRMLHYARTRCVGKPFSNVGMARSLLWPRHTDSSSFFCAELVAAILREGGLMDRTSNPGSATPEMLHRIYKNRTAMTANPFVLRDMQTTSSLSFASTVGRYANDTLHERATSTTAEREALLPPARALWREPSSHHQQPLAERRRADSPPRGHFRVVTHAGASSASAACACALARSSWQSSGATRTGLQLTLHSLDMSKRSRAPIA